MVLQSYVPKNPLSEFAAIFWYARGHHVTHATERILPGGTVELVINLAVGRTSESGMAGPHSQSFLIERSEWDELLGIHFKVGGIFPFLSFPAGEVHNTHITLADLCGERNAGRLLCRLHEAKTVACKFAVLEQWLTGIAAQPLKHHPAVSFAMREFQNDPGLLSSAQVAERVGFSQRRFIQIFRDQVGLTPKLFCRVQRFQEVIWKIHKLDEVDWVDTALWCGYFDQSHFNHDFKEFSGLSPTEYLQLRTENVGHVRVLEPAAASASRVGAHRHQ
jgi:AraC-like DNA-binding protein